ncbi:molybdopterin-binding protein [Niabella hibiscisoli]|uniref:molybdopterin-binding protein n=1 Tax=Niabella hibiscisoli TaxID=1825928 RepID=UPI001F0CE57B|nr:molybdopterin-binding protein [Niabella hibiscisoli]MCH5717672.1 molybdopterin-binding protein [Niabella hibiscisoli]
MDLSKYGTHLKDSFRITNHLKEPRSLLKDLKLVLLKDVLESVEIKSPGPKQLSECYLVAEASDGDKVVFSWNELFNTSVGDEVYLVEGYDGQAGVQMPNRIALLSTTDHATGRRYVKGLKKMVIKRVH